MVQPYGFLNAFIRGLVSLWILGAGLSTRSLEIFSAYLLPLPIAIIGGILANFCVILMKYKLSM